jgi:polysaccharide export outer membrane protein
VIILKKTKLAVLIILGFLVSACSYLPVAIVGHPPISGDDTVALDYTYLIGPGDSIDIYVWGNPDVSKVVTVRPDGKVTVPLVEDIQASGKTAFELARKLEEEYAQYIRDPQVVVMVAEFQGVDQQQIRVIGQVGNSGGDSGSNRYSGESIPYERGMTLMDVIIRIGSIGEFADGNRASIIRNIDGVEKQFGVRIDDLVEDGDMSENVKMFPGDILVIPEAYF